MKHQHIQSVIAFSSNTVDNSYLYAFMHIYIQLQTQVKEKRATCFRYAVSSVYNA